MSTSIDNLLTQYDTGKLSRRNLLAPIALICRAKAGACAGPFPRPLAAPT